MWGPLDSGDKFPTSRLPPSAKGVALLPRGGEASWREGEGGGEGEGEGGGEGRERERGEGRERERGEGCRGSRGN